MDFDVSHRIADTDVAAYERLYFDEAFNTALCRAVGLARRLVQLRTEGDLITRVVEVTPDREVPAAVRKILGGKTIAYTETITYRLGSGRGTWTSASSVLTDRIASDGTLEIAASPKGGVVRRVTGHVTVKIFGLGGLVEKFIAADIGDGYRRAAAFTENYLAEAR